MLSGKLVSFGQMIVNILLVDYLLVLMWKGGSQQEI